MGRKGRRCPAGNYEVVVGNIGQVYKGKNCKDAMKTYREYVKMSKSGDGRAGGESVTMFRNNQIDKEHYGKHYGDYEDYEE